MLKTGELLKYPLTSHLGTAYTRIGVRHYRPPEYALFTIVKPQGIEWTFTR
jgi:hypothetical protein